MYVHAAWKVNECEVIQMIFFKGAGDSLSYFKKFLSEYIFLGYFWCFVFQGRYAILWGILCELSIHFFGAEKNVFWQTLLNGSRFITKKL